MQCRPLIIDELVCNFFVTLSRSWKVIESTRPGVDKVKPKGWFKYSLLTLRISVGLFHHVLVYMGDLQLVHTELNLSTLDAGILIMVQ